MNNIKPTRFIQTMLALVCCAATVAAAAMPTLDKAVQRGRYLVKVSGCNDCHTPNYGMKNGQVEEAQWLTGDGLGWSGPWGTTYATNLRLLLVDMTEQQWLRHARTMEPRPPMPWFNVRAMSDADLKAIYAYVRAMGPAGSPVPAYVPPGGKPTGPVVQFPQ